VFLAIVADTRYSMLMHPDVTGTLSVTLRGVTVLEALESIRDVYGYDFKIDGRRITVYAPTLQTRIFTINYPHTSRNGKSDLRVSSGAMPTGSSGGQSGTGRVGASGGQSDSSSVTTSSQTDLWEELAAAVCSIIGAESESGACRPTTKVAGTVTSNSPVLGPSTLTSTTTVSRSGSGLRSERNVIISPQAGLMAVRAFPDQLREVEKFLKAAQLAVERQVMLEAKIVEVELRDGFQSGIDWSALRNGGGATGVMGVIGGGTANNILINGVAGNVPGFPTGGTAVANALALPNAGGGLFGLALATEGFQAVLGFLETRGDVQILSSPRIATMNNQKALLKVGTDEYYVTGFNNNTTTATTTTGTTGTQNTNAPTPEFSSMFAGIALDVMPQIDSANNITLHIRPSVTSITEKNMQISLGTTGNFQLPLASRAVNESDTIVRIQDGNIVAIGGLMQMESNRRSAGMPGTTDVPFFSSLLGHKSSSGRKKELVVLIKPTIIRSSADWEDQTRRTRAALDDMDATRSRVIRMDGSLSPAQDAAK
jgi:MSHA biogenesis protein MshL